jgi:acylphosphatase
VRNEARLYARIAGRVQGVGFRYYAERQARRLGLTGWVRNLPDGDVELVAEGEENALQQMLAWCNQGPPSAAVTQVQTDWATALGEFADFRVRR